METLLKRGYSVLENDYSGYTLCGIFVPDRRVMPQSDYRILAYLEERPSFYVVARAAEIDLVWREDFDVEETLRDLALRHVKEKIEAGDAEHEEEYVYWFK